MPTTDRLLTATQVAERLGVEAATVYAYVSRGSLTRLPAPEGRGSRYHEDEVELLARRSRPRSVRRRTGAVDVVIGTTVSEIGDGWIRYRDTDLLDLAGSMGFEGAARLLWTGERDGSPWPTTPTRTAASAAASRAVLALPPGAPISARLAVAAAAAGAVIAAPPADAPPVDTSADPTPAAAALIDALVVGADAGGTRAARSGRPARAEATVAARLWPAFSPLAPTPARVAVLDLALVLLAEHELATSTLAVRVAASTGAGPAEVVLAGLGTVAGPLHGQAAVRVHRRLLAAEADPTAAGAPAERDGRRHADGFGHVVHQHGDPRYPLLAAAVASIASDRRRAVIEADLTACRQAGAPAPNVDAALGALGYVARADPGATEAVFAIARTAGWLAHAFEEADETPLRFRGRTLYRGPR